MPTSVEAGDPVHVLVSVQGCSGILTQPVNFDGVLVIDMSNSMDDDPPQSDPTDKRLDAAIAFVNCVAPQTRLAVVTFSDDAELLQALTSDKSILRSKIDSLRGRADGSTNMYDAMDIAQQHLIDFSYAGREKFIILLTDGMDNSGHSDLDFMNLADDAHGHGIRYLTIGLGEEADLARLFMIAVRTGGEWYISVDASQLLQIYTVICQYLTYQAKTREITLIERLNPQVKVVPGSVVSDIEGLTQEQINEFVTTGQMNVSLVALGSGEGKFVRFDIFSNCLNPDSVEERVNIGIDDLSSKVTYFFGNQEGQVMVPQRIFECTRPGDLRCRKEYDFRTSILTITCESRYLPGAAGNTIRNIRIIERPSIYFQPRLSSVSPPATLVFPETRTDVLVWEIPKLGPQEVIRLTVYLEPTVCSSQYAPPIVVNAGKDTGGGPGEISYLRPNGTSNTIPMPIIRTSLSNVETCDGRADISIAPAYTFSEYDQPPQFSPHSVLFKHDSSAIWVDSYVPNGFWDGVAENVGDYISGATLRETSSALPAEERIQVFGQGDFFKVDSKNSVIARIGNHGSKASGVITNGATLYVYNYVSSNWESIASENIPQIAPGERKLLKFPISQNTLQARHIKPYSLPLRYVMRLISILNPNLGTRMRDWANSNPSQWSSLENQGEILPEDVLNMLPNTCPWYDPYCWVTTTLRERFQQFLSQYGDVIAWGNRSAKTRIMLKGPDSERHTNNNISEEIFIVR
jgi:hypothetical protein